MVGVDEGRGGGEREKVDEVDEKAGDVALSIFLHHGKTFFPR